MSSAAVRRSRRAVEHLGLLALLALRTIAAGLRPPIPWRATVYQMHIQGVRALGLAAVGGFFSGMALALQIGTGLARFGAISIMPQLSVIGLFRELIPVMIGLVIGGRLGAGIAAELGTMAVTEQVDAVRVMGADPVRELVVPRVLSATLVLPLITVFADLVAVVGAMLIAWIDHSIGVSFFVHSAREFVLPEDLASGVLKSAGFGGVIALLACWHGGRATGGADGVGRATTRTVVQGALAVIISDYFLSRVLAPVLAKGPMP